MFSYGFPRHWSTLRKLLWLKLLQGAAAVVETVTGTLPLTLANALSHAILSLTRYGLCKQDGTPTPDAPVDIWCNNGRLAFGKPLTLDPTRYYAYIGTSNTWSYSTDSYSIVIPVTVGKKYKITADPTTPIDGSVVNIILRWGFVDTIYDDWKQSAVAPSPISVTIYDWARSTPQDTQSVEVTATHPYMVIQMGAAAFASNLANGRIGVAVQKIYTDGEDEVLTVSGINLLDPSTSNIKIGQQVTVNGDITSAYPNNWRTDYIPVVGGKTYAFWGRAKADDTISAYNRINWFTADKTHISPRPSYTVDTVTIATAPSNAAFALLSCSPYKSDAAITREQFDLFNWMFAEASAEIPYQPYVQPQTVTVPMLLSTGENGVDDEVEFIQGIKAGKVRAIVFDGTESDWTFDATYDRAIIRPLPNFKSATTRNIKMLCTHFVSKYNGEPIGDLTVGDFYNATQNGVVFHVAQTSLEDWKAYLAAQYAAGTPVIVIYPRATETTEQGTTHHLSTHQGTNTVDSTANVGPVEAKVEYMKAA